MPRMTVLDDPCVIDEARGFCTVHKSMEKPYWFGICYRKAASVIGEIEHPVEHNQMKARVWKAERAG